MYLSQHPLIETGESFMKELPASYGWSTVTLPLDSFKQPYWTVNKAALKVDDIIAIAFAPEVYNVDNFVESYIKIKDIKLCGPKINLSNHDIYIKSYSLTKDHLHLLLTKDDVYDVNVISPETGSVYSQKGQKLSKGFNKISLGKSLAPGQYILDLTTTNTHFIKKVNLLDFKITSPSKK